MNKKPVILLTSAFAVFAVICTLKFWSSGDTRESKDMFIDSYTRSRASNIDADKVKSINITGINMGRMSGLETDEIKIEHKPLIKLFVQALAAATTNSNIRFGNGVDTLKIKFSPSSGRKSERFSFNAEDTNHWYGEKFRDALNELSTFQAAETREKADSISLQQLKAAELGTRKIKDRSELASLLDALRNVDETAFAYTTITRGTRGSNFEALRLFTHDGGTMSFHFVPAPTPSTKEVEPLWKLYNSKN